MIEKIDKDAYFVIDVSSFYTQITIYDPLVANQNICHSEYVDIPVEAIKTVAPSKVDEADISRFLIEDQEFKKSIERAKEEMKRGDAYLSHKDVFEAD